MSDDTSSISKLERLLVPLATAALSALCISDLILKKTPISLGADWISVLGAILFPTLTVVFAQAFRRGWSDERTEEAMMRTFGFIALVPVVLVGIVIAGGALYFFFGGLATTPAWAALIIYLLLREQRN